MSDLLKKLILASQIAENSNDPLFGGLIPQRVERELPAEVSHPVQVNPVASRQQPIIPRSGINRLSEDRPMNVRFQNSGDTLLEEGRARSNALFDSYSRPKNAPLGYQNNQQLPGSQMNVVDSKIDLDHRKQALDEWKAHNPNGQIKTDKDGRIVLINPVTGKTTDTGLKSGDMSDEDKRKHKLEDDKALIAERAKQQRISDNTKPIKDKDSERVISPSQQRVAEDDSARELLNDPRYSFLKDNGIITFDKSGGLNIDNAKAGDKWKNHITEFNKELKAKSDERTNKTLTVNNNREAPTAPEGYEYVRNKEDNGWTAVEKKK